MLFYCFALSFSWGNFLLWCVLYSACSSFPLCLHISMPGKCGQDSAGWPSLSVYTGGSLQEETELPRWKARLINYHLFLSFSCFLFPFTIFSFSFFFNWSKILLLSETDWCNFELVLTFLLVIRMKWQSLHHDTSRRWAKGRQTLCGCVSGMYKASPKMSGSVGPALYLSKSVSKFHHPQLKQKGKKKCKQKF